MTEDYTGSYQEYLDDMGRDDAEDHCPGCGRPFDVDCHPVCEYMPDDAVDLWEAKYPALKRWRVPERTET